MRVSAIAVSLVCLASPLAALSQQRTSPERCRTGIIEGEVKEGQQFIRRIGSGLEVMLEPLPLGWVLRVLPVSASRPAHDYAELATPPYHSISPLLISTDFSFRAQDAVGWTPRRFRYAPDRAAFTRLLKAYESYEAKPGASPASQNILAELVAQSPGGILTILDAHLVPGIADQASTVAVVASHFSTTPHVIEPPPNGRPSPLGKITWFRFRIALQLPREFSPAAGLEVKSVPCGNL